MEYRLNITIMPSSGEYSPITLKIGITEYQARVLQATPVKGVDLSVERTGGYLVDKTSKLLDFNPGGNVPR